MNLEVGKVYLMSNGKPARCICTDRRRHNGITQAMFLTQNATVGCEDLHVTNNDGTAFNGYSFKVVKEYVPPNRIRVVTLKYVPDGKIVPVSVAEQQYPALFSAPDYPKSLRRSKSYVVLDDRIFEVEDK